MSVSGQFRRDLVPPPRQFYEGELGELSRPRKGWAMVKAGCPFHASKSKKSFFVNVYHGGWVCYGCDSKGDLTGFVMRRYHLGFREAAQRVGAWSVITPEERGTLDERRQREKKEADRKAQAEADARADRLDARDWLLAAARNYQEACDEGDWLAMSDFLPRVRTAESRYCRLAGLEDPYAV